MRRIYEPAAYLRPEACYWDDTVTPPQAPPLAGDTVADVAVIGGGFTGLNAALELADRKSVV